MISYPASTFWSGEVIVDSGTTRTQLVEPTYNALLATVRSTVKALVAYDDPLCYNSSDVVLSKLSRIAFYFAGNAKLVAPPRNSFTRLEDEKDGIDLFLLEYEIAGPVGGTFVLGNILQQNFNFIFDTANNKLSFAPAVCDNL